MKPAMTWTAKDYDILDPFTPDSDVGPMMEVQLTQHRQRSHRWPWTTMAQSLKARHRWELKYSAYLRDRVSDVSKWGQLFGHAAPANLSGVTNPSRCLRVDTRIS
jgi:hypothetical protein